MAKRPELPVWFCNGYGSYASAAAVVVAHNAVEARNLTDEYFRGQYPRDPMKVEVRSCKRLPCKAKRRPQVLEHHAYIE